MALLQRSSTHMPFLRLFDTDNLSSIDTIHFSSFLGLPQVALGTNVPFFLISHCGMQISDLNEFFMLNADSCLLNAF